MENNRIVWGDVSELYFPAANSYISSLIENIPELIFMHNNKGDIDLTVNPSFLICDKINAGKKFCQYYMDRNVEILNTKILDDLNIFSSYDPVIDTVINYFYFNKSTTELKVNNIWERYNSEREKYSLEIKNTIRYNDFLIYLNCKWRIENIDSQIFMSFIKIKSGKCNFCNDKSFLEIEYDGIKILSCLKENCLFKNCFELGFCCYLEDDRIDFFSIPPSPLSTQFEESKIGEKEDYYISSVETSNTSSEEEIDTENIKLEYSSLL